jgi:hypothetical protein
VWFFHDAKARFRCRTSRILLPFVFGEVKHSSSQHCSSQETVVIRILCNIFSYQNNPFPSRRHAWFVYSENYEHRVIYISKWPPFLLPWTSLSRELGGTREATQLIWYRRHITYKMHDIKRGKPIYALSHGITFSENLV